VCTDSKRLLEPNCWFDKPMLNRIRIDRRVLYGFLTLMFVMNVDVFFVHWQWMMDGKNDFAPLYSSAQMVREGQGSRLYDFDAENSFLHRISDIARPPNNHFPYENLIFVPFTYFRFGAAHILWTLLSVGILVGVALLIRDARPGGSSFLLTLLPVLAFFPVWFCLYCGQDSILLLLLFALSFWLWKRGQDDMAGFVLALGLFRPQLVLPFVLVVFLGGKWKFVRGFIPGAVLVVALSTWVVGFHGMAAYARILISQGTESSAGTLAEQWHVWPQMMPTLRGLLGVCLPSGTPGMIQNVLLLCGTFGALLWVAKRMRGARDGAAFDMAFAVAVAAVTLVSFHSFLWDFSLIILLILIAGGVMASSPTATKKSAYTIVTIAYLFFFTPLYVVLVSTVKVGLLFLPAIAATWLMSRWGQGSLPEFAADVDGAQS
jgi:Glycosyltransferase family 87